MEIDPRSLLRPSRPALSAMRAATAHCTSVDELWETLVARDMLPARILDAPERRFFIGASQSKTVSADESADIVESLRARGHLPFYQSAKDPSLVAWNVLAPRPQSIEHALAFASSFADAERAEAICMETFAETLRARAKQRATITWVFPEPRMTDQWRRATSIAPTIASTPDNLIESLRVSADEAIFRLGFIVSALIAPGVLVLVMPTLGVGGIET